MQDKIFLFENFCGIINNKFIHQQRKISYVLYWYLHQHIILVMVVSTQKYIIVFYYCFQTLYAVYHYLFLKAFVTRSALPYVLWNRMRKNCIVGPSTIYLPFCLPKFPSTYYVLFRVNCSSNSIHYVHLKLANPFQNNCLELSQHETINYWYVGMMLVTKAYIVETNTNLKCHQTYAGQFIKHIVQW